MCFWGSLFACVHRLVGCTGMNRIACTQFGGGGECKSANSLHHCRSSRFSAAGGGVTPWAGRGQWMRLPQVRGRPLHPPKPSSFFPDPICNPSFIPLPHHCLIDRSISPPPPSLSLSRCLIDQSFLSLSSFALRITDPAQLPIASPCRRSIAFAPSPSPSPLAPPDRSIVASSIPPSPLTRLSPDPTSSA